MLEETYLQLDSLILEGDLGFCVSAYALKNDQERANIKL